MESNPAFRFDPIADFDRLALLAKSNPDVFERLRVSIVDAFIASIPAEKAEMMRRLQWRLDQERKRVSSPTASLLALSRMMWESLNELRDHQNDLIAYLNGDPVAETPVKSADVISIEEWKSKTNNK